MYIEREREMCVYIQVYHIITYIVIMIIIIINNMIVIVMFMQL